MWIICQITLLLWKYFFIMIYVKFQRLYKDYLGIRIWVMFYWPLLGYWGILLCWRQVRLLGWSQRWIWDVPLEIMGELTTWSYHCDMVIIGTSGGILHGWSWGLSEDVPLVVTGGLSTWLLYCDYWHLRWDISWLIKETIRGCISNDHTRIVHPIVPGWLLITNVDIA